jgi:hypothetical protein
MIIDQKVKELYAKELSGSEIANKLGLHIRQVYRLLVKQGVQRRNSAEQNKLRFKRSPLSFKFKDKLSVKGRELFIAALMLYYGEGAKTGKCVDFANADPATLKIFLKFIREICRVNERRLRFYLYCFSNQNSAELIKFWCKTLTIKKENFTKPYIRDSNGSLTRTMPYGVLHIRYSDSRLLNRILDLNRELTIKIIGGVLKQSTRADCR